MKKRCSLLRVAFLLHSMWIVLLFTACSSQAIVPTPTPALADELIFYDWVEDMPQSVLDAFQDEYGITVTYIPYETQEEALANIQAGKVYDVVVIDNDFVPELWADNLLAEIDYRYVPNFKNISANFRDLVYDPGNKHSVPFNWGTTALLVRDDLVAAPITRWADLWTLETVKVAVRNEPREPLGIALKALGYSANSENPEEVRAAFEHLLRIRDRILIVESYAEAAIPLLVSGEAAILVGWAEDVLYSRDENLALTHIYPEEGPLLWGDNFVIPANSPRRYTAETFLNFLLRPEIAAQIVNENYYATPNDGAYDFIDPEIRDDSVIFPSSEDLANAEVLLPLSPEATALYAELWERFVNGQQ